MISYFSPDHLFDELFWTCPNEIYNAFFNGSLSQYCDQKTLYLMVCMLMGKQEKSFINTTNPRTKNPFWKPQIDKYFITKSTENKTVFARRLTSDFTSNLKDGNYVLINKPSLWRLKNLLQQWPTHNSKCKQFELERDLKENVQEIYLLLNLLINYIL